jgi:Fe-S oxidoreductase
VEALEDAGFHVVMPRTHLCCGRPLYDYGLLNGARRYLERVVDALREEIRAGTPVVGIEPSCVAVFRDELPRMLPHDEDAIRLAKQTFHLAEFLEQRGYEPPALAGHAVVHGHCHEKATSGFDPVQKLLEQTGLELEVPDSGCCGMAGAWGYEPSHYDVSMAAAERVLLPKVREAPRDTLLVANGFSCRTQIQQGAQRDALHVAQVLRLARTGRTPEAPEPSSRRRLARAAAVGAAALACALAAANRRRARSARGI